jgi:hypothetical protein
MGVVPPLPPRAFAVPVGESERVDAVAVTPGERP